MKLITYQREDNEMPEVATTLSPELFTSLQSETIVLLSTIDAEHGGPVTSAISWVYAVNENQIRFAVDARSRIVMNIRSNSLVNATLFANGTVNVIYGSAKIVQDSLEDVPFNLVCIDIHIETIRDSMFYGAKISVHPEYEKTYDLRAAKKLDQQVFAAMKKVPILK
jgi:hypothetical protein